MSKKETVIIWKRKRKRKIPETIQHRLGKIARRRKAWEYRKRQEVQQQELDEISSEYEDLSHEELTRHIAWLSLRYHEISAQAQEFEQELQDAELEMYRIMRSDPTALALDEDIGTHDLAGRLHKLAGVSVANGRMMQSTLLAKKGARKRLVYDKDRTQEAKRFVYECWQDWQNSKSEYASQAAFAKEMLSKWEGILTSQPSIENWCRQWKKGQNIPLTEPAQ